jgi:hypothetical protein
MLDQRPVDDRQHFLWHGLCGRQEPGAETGHGEDGFADGFHAVLMRLARGAGRNSPFSLLPKLSFTVRVSKAAKTVA